MGKTSLWRLWPLKLLTTALVAAKAAEVQPFSNWSWWTCFSPLLIYYGGLLLLFIACLIYAYYQLTRRFRP